MKSETENIATEKLNNFREVSRMKIGWKTTT